MVRQGNKQTGKAGERAAGNNERTRLSALGATSRSYVAWKMFQKYWSNPSQGNGPYWAKAGMAEAGAANINTRSGRSIRDAGA